MGGDTPMDVVYDTGSDWLVVEGMDCWNCEGNVYDPFDELSDLGRASRITEAWSTREYGSAYLEGYEYLDTVCLTPNASTCIENFEYFLIFYQEGLWEPVDGILGLSRNNPFFIGDDYINYTGPLFVEYLAKEGVIDANKFSFYLQ